MMDIAGPSALPPTQYLRVFHCVAQLGSMSKASAQLRRAQSAVQRTIQQLEESLETRLFERTSRGILLTDSGKVLQGRVDHALAEMETARQALSMQGGTQPRHNAPIFSLALNERRLAILTAFSHYRHMSVVAQLLDVSQPAVSMTLRELEDSLGLTLFDRSSSPIGLTPAAELLLAHIKRALYQLRLARAEIAAQDGTLKGDITIGALPFGRPYILPTAIATLHAEHPALRFTTVEGPLETLSHALWCGDIDFIMGALPASEPYADLVQEDLFHDKLVVIARSGHPLETASAAIQTLADADWVLPPRRTPTRDVLMASLASLGAPPLNVTVESTDLSLIRGLLLGSNMLTAASRHLFQHELRNGMLSLLSVDLPDTQRTIGVLRRPQEHSSPGATRLIQVIRALGEALKTRGIP